MTTHAGSGIHKRRWLRITLIVLAALVVILVVPPMIGVSRYKSQITQLISQSVRRPVRLSSVKVRLLPWPGFVLSDLSVAEDPAYGAEPVLHANTVTASIRLLALLRGRVEIGKISVDEASLNLVRSAPGQWNLDPIFRTAAEKTGTAAGNGNRPIAALPYLVATNSRINFKNGVEKLPFSLVNTDLSFWQESSGGWRLRLRGQPARTDVSLFQEETGIVRMEATIRRAALIHDMPLQIDLDWSKAQLGQLARLVLGSDPGWRGDLTGNLRLDGTADSAHVTTRLRAEGVHRVEYTPTSSLDFDANCAFEYHYEHRSLQKLTCDSPIGKGRVRVTGDEISESGPPGQFVVEMDRVPVDAGLDTLRALRKGFAPDLEAKGTVSGKIQYTTADESRPEPVKPAHGHSGAAAPASAPFTGSLIVEDLALSGGGLSQPVQAPKFTLEPAKPVAPMKPLTRKPVQEDRQPDALVGTVAIPAGGAVPLAFNLRFTLAGYQVGVRGPATYTRARELAHAAGLPATDALASLAGDPIAIDLTAAGPWLPSEEMAAVASPAANAPGSAPPAPAAIPAAETLTGVVTLRNANWRSDSLAGHVVITEAMLHVDSSGLRWDPVQFAYGPLKGTAIVELPAECPQQTTPPPCTPHFQLRFAELDASVAQSVLLGVPKKGTLLSKFIDRVHPATAPLWPRVEGTVIADQLDLDPIKLKGATAELRVQPTGAEIESFNAGLFGGTVHLTGTLTKPSTDRDKLTYALDGSFDKLNAAELGHLFNLRWTGSTVSGKGSLELAGYTGDDLASSAKGSLHFECRQGSIAAAKPAQMPAALAHFDRWTADASIANGSIQLGQNEAAAGSRKQAVEATIPLAIPPRINFPAPKDAKPQKH